jgi:LexA-binding, inner membrane-associated putative hydrolase
MNLTTHWILALALGIALFHNVEIALVISIGALIPDLDREYLFVARNFIGRHQLHRSLFHNFLFIGAMYFLNPFLSLGALSHSLLDMFTSATDRGSEVLFPFTRVINPYYYSIEGDRLPEAKKETEWWVEDPWRLLEETSDRDLQEPKTQPWRRSYGPFKNSRVVDWGIFFASLVFLGTVYAASNGSMYSLAGLKLLVLLPLGGIAIFYGLGEYWRRKLLVDKTKDTNYFVLGVLIIGLAIFAVGGYYSLLSFPGIPNFTLAFYALVSTLVGFAIAYVFVRVRKKYADISL